MYWRPRLITFDVNGTLLFTKPENFYAQAAKNYGLKHFNYTKALHAMKTSMQRLELEHPIYGKHTGLGWVNWWRIVVHDVFKDQYQDISPYKIQKIADNLIEWYSLGQSWRKYPGTIELLESLNKHDVVLGVISNADERLESILEAKGMRPYFSFILTSYNFGVHKPNPAIFQEALRLSSRGLNMDIKSDEALHIGDRLSRDYFAALSLGWKAIFMNWKNVPIDNNSVDPKNVFTNFEDLKEYLNGLLNKKSS